MPLQIITRAASTRVAEYAFKYAQDNGRKKVSAVHKANIMKLTDGLFIKCCREGAPALPFPLACTTVRPATLCFLCSESGPRVLLPLSAFRRAPHQPARLTYAAMGAAHCPHLGVTCCGLCWTHLGIMLFLHAGIKVCRAVGTDIVLLPCIKRKSPQHSDARDNCSQHTQCSKICVCAPLGCKWTDESGTLG